MTKKDYILLADALKRARPPMSAPDLRIGAWLDCVNEIVAALKADHKPTERWITRNDGSQILPVTQSTSTFNAAKFYAACGGN